MSVRITWEAYLKKEKKDSWASSPKNTDSQDCSGAPESVFL